MVGRRERWWGRRTRLYGFRLIERRARRARCLLTETRVNAASKAEAKTNVTRKKLEALFEITQASIITLGSPFQPVPHGHATGMGPRGSNSF